MASSSARIQDRVFAQLNRWIDRLIGPTRLRIAGKRRPLRIVVGASGIAPAGWVPTEARYLDLTESATWMRFFEPHSVDTILAEHVWEHLTPAQATQGARTCLRFLAPSGRLRMAIPDGNHPDPEYIEWVRPGGTGPGATDHKVLYTLETLTSLFEDAGFRVVPLEWHDKSGAFHSTSWDPADGMIQRSARFDRRNSDGKLRYTSLIVDCFPKPTSES